MKDEPNNDDSDVDEKSVIINDDEKSDIINDDSDDDGKSAIVNSYISKINILNLNEKLSSFYQGIYDKQTHHSYEITNVESSAIISYRSNSSNTEDCLICELAYTTFDEKMKAHVLNLKEIKIETGFYLPVTTMYFHHDDKNDRNKLYLCGDVRVKEFTIEGLDKINNENYQDEIVIWNSNTFYFGKHDFASTVITVLENELVLGYGNDLYFWNIENERKVRNKKEKLKIEQKDYKNMESILIKLILLKVNTTNQHRLYFQIKHVKFHLFLC